MEKEKLIIKFSEELKIPKKMAEKLVDKMYEHDLNIENGLHSILWTLKQKVLQKALDDGEEVDDTLLEDAILSYKAELAKREASRFNNKNEISWFFSTLDSSEFKELKEGDKVDIQIMRSGEWNHQLYGKVKLTNKDLDQVKKNFDENNRGIELAVDENHEPNHRALGWYRSLQKKGKDALYATIELTKAGAEMLSQGLYKYFSPELIHEGKDEETGKVIKNMLIGGAFTNRPFFKRMQPLMASEVANNDQNSSNVIIFKNPKMIKFFEIMESLVGKKSIDKESLDKLKSAYSEISEDQMTPEIKSAYEKAVKLYNEGDQEDAGDGDGTGDGGAKKPDTGDVEGEGEGDDEDKPEVIEASEFKALLSQNFSEDKDGNIILKASEFQKFIGGVKNMQSNLSKMSSNLRKQKFTESVGKFVFSEKSNCGVVPPAMKDEVIGFALSLSENQSDKFLGILQKLNKVSAVMFGEVGARGTDLDYDPAHVEFMKSRGFSEEDAIASAKEVFKES